MAITLDVFTKISEQSLRTSSSLVEQTFTKSGQRAGEDFGKALAQGIEKSPEFRKKMDSLADSLGRVRVEQEKLDAINAKANATDAQKIQQAERLAKAQREVARGTEEAAAALDRTRTSTNSLLSTVSNLAAGTRFGGIIADADSLAAKFGGVGLAAGGAIAGVAAIGTAAVALGKQLYDVGKTWDDVSDSITARTGKVGAELENITDRIGKVASNTAVDLNQLAGIYGQSMQSLRLSGDQLDDMSQKIAELNNLTGEQTNIRDLGLVFRMFGVQAGDQSGVLDGLYTMFQKTGIPVNDLLNTLQKSGPILSEFGMNFAQAAGFVNVFEDAGVSADAAVKGLRFALKNLAEAGVEPKQGLQQIITEIQNLIAAGDDVGARDLAEQRFGKGFSEILRAIRENRIEIERLPDSIDTITPSIDNATKQTEDFAEEWQKFKNNLETVVKPAAEGFFSWMNGEMTNLLGVVDKFSAAWKEWSNGDWWKNSPLYKAFDALGLTSNDTNRGMVGGGGDFGTAAVAPSSAVGGVNLATIPAAVQKYANNCIDASAQIILSGAGINMSQEEIERVIPRGGSIDSLAAGLNKINPQGNFVPLPGSGGSQQAMFNAIKASIDKGVGSILNVAPGSSIGGQNFADGHFIAITGYGPDGSINLSDTANGRTYSVSAAEAFAASRGRGIVAGTGAGRSPQGTGIGPLSVGSGITFPPSTTQPAPVPSGPATTYTPSNLPSAADVAPASPNLAPVQMVPSPFGPQYAPVPAGATPGYNQTGTPGYYMPDPKQIETQTRRYEDSQQAIADANKAIEDAKQQQVEAAQKAAEVEQDIYSTAEDRARAQRQLKNANDAVERASRNAQRATQNAEEAQQQLAEAKLGTFRENQKAAEARAGQSKTGQFDASLADDFGLSEGLPGLAKWLTTFAANMAMAPMVGQLSSVAASSPYQGGFGMLGMMGANNMAAGLTPLGLSSGASVMPSAMGPAPLGGGLGAMLPPMGSPAGGDARSVTAMPSYAPSPGSGGGFQGLGGLPMAALQLAGTAAGLAAPGVGQAAQMGVQLANRTAAYAGQLAGIGVGGLLETFLPHGSPIADPGKSWLGKLASGFSGARPALPNTAGPQQADGQPGGQAAPPQTPEQAQALAGAPSQGGSASGPMVHVENMNNYSNDGGQAVANQIGRLQMSAYASGGPR